MADPKKQEETHAETIANLQKLLDEKTKQAEDYLNTLKRVQADFENYIKRSDKERKEFIDVASAPLLTKLLTFLDDFDHMLASTELQNLPGETKQGLQMIHDKFMSVLTSEGVKPISCTGKADPHLHEVILVDKKSDKPDNMIVQELQKGYTLKDKVLRYAKVKVAKTGGN